MNRLAILLLLLALGGCSSSKPAPKPLSSGPQLSQDQAAIVLKDAEAKQPCSEQNLKNATEEQKRNCNPSQGMFDNVKPTQTPPKAPKQPSRTARKS
jgi:hypothetical protein